MIYECHYIHTNWHECMKEMRRVIKILDNLGFRIDIPTDGKVLADHSKFKINFIFSTSTFNVKEFYLSDSQVKSTNENKIIIGKDEGVIILRDKEILGQVK